ncbi:MAG: YkgJ family cysteine cluster protein [Bdellovibrio sp.]|nr:YkgJ family cysteine cluster protein [Bdellovibrio sp.]
MTHPCLTCGACCAFFRVSFHWSETLTTSHAVPEDLTLQINPYMNAMKGTETKSPRCISLKGDVGGVISCEIYANRPECCRSFSASFEDGTVNERCAQARISKGLTPLALSSWVSTE